MKWHWVTNFDVREPLAKRRERQNAWVKKNYLDPICLTDIDMRDGKPYPMGHCTDPVVLDEAEVGVPQSTGPYPMGGLYVPYDVAVQACMVNNRVDRARAERLVNMPPPPVNTMRPMLIHALTYRSPNGTVGP